MAEPEDDTQGSGWKGPDVPVWKGLLLVAVLVGVGAAVAFSGLPQLVSLSIAVLLVALTARWWRPWFRGEHTDIER